MKIRFDVKWGTNVIDVPICPEPQNENGGLSNLKDKTFTVINRIPTAAGSAQIEKWIKNTLRGCDRLDGIYDRTNGTMVRAADTWTAWLGDWQSFKSPDWLDDGYYTLTDDEKARFYTANVGDLLIFNEIPDSAPTDERGFRALIDKYKSMGGIITGVKAYINYKPNGAPWHTNHIELTRG